MSNEMPQEAGSPFTRPKQGTALSSRPLNGAGLPVPD